MPKEVSLEAAYDGLLLAASSLPWSTRLVFSLIFIYSRVDSLFTVLALDFYSTKRPER